MNQNITGEIQELDISLIDEYPNHPFKVVDDEKMIELTDSIEKNGVLLPILVRPKEGGRYEMISGHRRLRASELAEKKTIKAMVCDYDDLTAAIVMVESNINQRDNMLPSEKAFAYKILYDAMKHQGRQIEITSTPVVSKLRSNEELAYQVGESREQIRRYIRLTDLVPELLEYMDKGKMALRPAVELSYLDEESQRDIVDFIDENESTPSHAQAIRMRKLFENGKLDTKKIVKIMSEIKPNQKEKLVLHAERVRKYIPKTIPLEKTEEYVCKALEHYTKYLQKQKSRDAR
ncbi:MAG: ParB/RepB/Spo0J family partition protein [Clostridia bacterium]|nr:ParB/RepB/Spo0J family partition protein [Clostridia bacterium]MBR0413716.1 ParB/RepB/Spo0J family partition protein [Clostridia bacterium]